MFDRDKSGSIDASEFSQLWNYIQQWKQVFEGFDRDRSGGIDANELNTGKMYKIIIPDTQVHNWKTMITMVANLM